LGAEGRINKPGTGTGNWQWRMSEGAFTGEIKRKMAEIVGVYGRYYQEEEKKIPEEEIIPDDENLTEEESF
jgi:4-alpha-glucanotransferase